MKDEELKFEEIESSHTLGEYRRCRRYSAVRYTIVNRSRRICYHKGKGLVAKKTNGPVCMRERGAWPWGGCWCEYYSAVRCSVGLAESAGRESFFRTREGSLFLWKPDRRPCAPSHADRWFHGPTSVSAPPTPRICRCMIAEGLALCESAKVGTYAAHSRDRSGPIRARLTHTHSHARMQICTHTHTPARNQKWSEWSRCGCF
jgi:hypothetical protein